MSDWQRVQQVFFEVVDLPPYERAAFLKRCCEGNPDLLVEIESLLAADSGSGETIELAVQDEADSLFDTHLLVGERIGMYRIVRELGRGGMGCVYLALRDDQEYRKEVALKIVKRGMDTAEVLERFRYERQILAGLEHPYIARLFDGGTTSDGVPFFVMEYVEGMPVSVFCRERGLGFDAICELFVRILDGVAHAHRNLVVHRDLKPANILIAADGTPKLLDFGVAKLLSGDVDGYHTRTSVTRPFTPGYASPEQVRGLTITTATDIYSLGVILYELLAGRPAQLIQSNTPLEIDRVVCETEAVRPSAVVRSVPSDLDNIVLLAMRKQPERRYQSAVQFAEDLRRYLDGRPVIARADSFGYRARKFIGRNRWEVGAAGLVAVSMVAGLATSLVQTHRADAARALAESQRAIAEHQTTLAAAAALAESKQKVLADQQRVLASEQRDQAERESAVAEQQKGIAEQRVKDIFGLAGRALFDVHDSIAALPGSLAARKALVQTTLEYLETLEKSAGLDDEMREGLCAAYYKVAMAQGDPQGASLQDAAGAEKSLRKGEALLMPAYRRDPNSAALMLRLIETRATLAEVMYHSGRREEAVKEYMGLLPVAHRLSLVKDCTLNCWTQEPVLEGNLTYELIAMDPARALEHANHGIVLERALLVEHPGDPLLVSGLGSLMAGGAGAYRVLGRLEESAKYYKESIEAREELMRSEPTNAQLRRSLMIAYGNYTALLGNPYSANLNRPEEARIYGAKCVALARQSVAADKDDVTARRDLGMSLSRLGSIDSGSAHAAESLEKLEEARDVLEPIARASGMSSEPANQLAFVLEYIGRRQEALGRTAEAKASYRKSMDAVAGVLDPRNGPVEAQYLSSEEGLAVLEANTGDTMGALELAKQAVAEAQRYSQGSPHTDGPVLALAKAWSVLGITQAKAGLGGQAKESAAQAMTLWHLIAKPVLIVPFQQTVAETEALLDGTRAQP